MATDNQNTKIFLGHRPQDRAEYWRALSTKAKARLAQERRAGRFGGTPGSAPYWWVQNYGSSQAAIAGKQFIEKAVEVWRPTVRATIQAWLRS